MGTDCPVLSSHEMQLKALYTQGPSWFLRQFGWLLELALAG